MRIDIRKVLDHCTSLLFTNFQSGRIENIYFEFALSESLAHCTRRQLTNRCELNVFKRSSPASDLWNCRQFKVKSCLWKEIFFCCVRWEFWNFLSWTLIFMIFDFLKFDLHLINLRLPLYDHNWSFPAWKSFFVD